MNPIRAARTRRGLTRDKLGELLGVSGRTVSYWETGKKLPDPGRVGALKKVLDLTDLEVWRVTHRAAVKVTASSRKGEIW